MFRQPVAVIKFGEMPAALRSCGGVADKQTGLVGVPEYVRWSQHCALGAIHRYHGGPGHQPWLYSNSTETIIRSYLNLRMKLMPTLIAAGARATVDGTPITRRLDISFPEAGPNATRTDEYLWVDDTLIAPFSSGGSANGTATRDVWIPPGDYQESGTNGLPNHVHTQDQCTNLLKYGVAFSRMHGMGQV